MIDLVRIRVASAPSDEAQVWIVIRHGARGQLLPGDACDATPLSPSGVEESIHLGETIRSNGMVISGLWSSPLYRCLQTGEGIVKGYGERIIIERDDILAYPGSFLLEGQRSEISSINETDMDVRGASEGVSNVLNLLAGKHVRSGSSGLFVTHDAIVAPTLTYLTGEQFEYPGKWVRFLDGFALIRRDGRWTVVDMHGEAHDVNERMLQVIDRQ